jgi:hypothetical protein
VARRSKKQPVESLPLHPRLQRLLANHGIRYVEDLVKKCPKDLLQIWYVGKKKLSEIEQALAAVGLTLKENPPPPPPVDVNAAAIKGFQNTIRAFFSRKWMKEGIGTGRFELARFEECLRSEWDLALVRRVMES